MKSLGIIGFGSFGQFIYSHLKNYFNISIYDCNKKFNSLEEVCSSEVIILATPMREFENILNQIKDKLQPGTLIIDICSLKIYPIKLMLEILPGDVEIIGTHPLFGPNSAKDGIENLKITLCEVRSSNFENVVNFCKNKLKLDVFITTPQVHDSQMALSQALTHFIGHIAKDFDLHRIDLSTKTFDNLMDVIETIENNSQELFEDMQILNPYSKDVREKFIQSSKNVNDYLNQLKLFNELDSRNN